MKIEIFDSSKAELWNRFVSSHPEATPSHSSGYFLLMERHQKAINRSLMAFDEGGVLVGVLPMIELTLRELRVVTVRELNCRGPLLNPDRPRPVRQEALVALIDGAKRIAARVGSDRIAVAYACSVADQLAVNHFGYLPVKEFGFREQNAVSLFLDLRQDEEALFRNLDSKCRNMIRRAQKGGASVSILSCREDWLRCYDINVQTLGPASYSRESMGIVWDEFIAKDIAMAVAVQIEGRPMSVVVASAMNNSSTYWLGFNAQPRTLPGSNNYALWEAILLCKKRGVRWFNLGPLDFSPHPKQRSIAAFKNQFGGIPAYVISGLWERKAKKRAVLNLTADCVARVRHGIAPLRSRQASPQDKTKSAGAI